MLRDHEAHEVQPAMTTRFGMDFRDIQTHPVSGGRDRHPHHSREPFLGRRDANALQSDPDTLCPRTNP